MRKPLYPTIMDFEASGFGAHSYPIEVGVINDKGERYCSLIKPVDDWQHWSLEAEKIHGISRETLCQYGKSARQVCRELNQFLGETTCYSDAWTHDSPWLNRLYFAARTNPSFRLSSIELIASEAQLLCWDKVKQRLTEEMTEVRHRASGDALLIQQTYIATRDLIKQQHKQR